MTVTRNVWETALSFIARKLCSYRRRSRNP
ncbi:hypothetical protein C4K37_4065 [Pseudomonas chlororaphis subsp. piscium]|uniref:Uncharacterized protein n=1 Tax=Pseudomonas chlororaphis TaxID=587753 RepID=A0AAX3FUC7_9PSED|nr:hypothetical protein C4K37_4065 [Pseudomonas chlororaphis subsp. piscium]AZC44998.1 hypothetical protein C4K36_4076 [Pseudomonas chlororaphis subsp. piscium]VEF72937.1 Uncharacterised protein [Pseudomonas chlororaphis]